MSKGTSLKEAIKQFETAKSCVAAEAKKVELWGRNPPIEKLDATLATLKECRHLALSSNNISKIACLAGLDKLEILSLARNTLTRIEGLEAVGATLEQLWLSYNQIGKLGGLEQLVKLRVLYLANNGLREYKELEAVPQTVEELSLLGNPLQEAAAKADGPTSAIGCSYRLEVLRRLPGLKKLDGVAIDADEREAAAAAGRPGGTLMGTGGRSGSVMAGTTTGRTAAAAAG